MGGVDEFARWALESEQHKTYAQIASLLQPMLESFAQFRRMQNCADEAGSYRCLRNEGFVTWRNNVRVTRAWPSPVCQFSADPVCRVSVAGQSSRSAGNLQRWALCHARRDRPQDPCLRAGAAACAVHGGRPEPVLQLHGPKVSPANFNLDLSLSDGPLVRIVSTDPSAARKFAFWIPFSSSR